MSDNTDAQPTPDEAVAAAAAALDGGTGTGPETPAETPAEEPKINYFRDEGRQAIYAKRSEQVVAPGDESLQAMARASAEGLPEDFSAPAVVPPAQPNGEAAAPVVAAVSGVPAAPAVAAVTPADDAAAAEVRLQIAEARIKAQNEAAADNFRRAEELLAQAQQRVAGSAQPTGDAAADPGQEVMDALMTSDPAKLRASLAQIVKEVVPQAAPASPATSATPATPAAPVRSAESVRLANYVFEREFGDVFGHNAAFGAAKQAMIERMNDPQYAGVPLDLMARDIGYGVRKQFAADLAPSPAIPPAVDPVAQQLATREAAKQRLPRSVTAGAPQIAQPAAPANDGLQSRSTYVQQLRGRSGSNSAIRGGEAQLAAR